MGSFLEPFNLQATTGTHSPPAGATAFLATHVLRPKMWTQWKLPSRRLSVVRRDVFGRAAASCRCYVLLLQRTC
jgi:hypothetical protein